jgi:hypothetical protein
LYRGYEGIKTWQKLVFFKCFMVWYR